ncbi:MAG: hypothetical protein FK733_09735 [Asgard group archaeon]|nr:hypothetical protein [Asgard group archaeon]
MGRIGNKLLRNKKGQLFLLEVFIALSVLILLMLALYQIEFTSVPTYQDDLSEIGFDALDSLNQAGELKPLVYNMLTSDLADSLDEILPANVLWRLTVEDDTGATIFSIYDGRTPPVDASIGVTDYFLYGYESNLNIFRVVHLELWRLIG